MSFTVYRSSAGSGKTFSLVREYLTIVLSHPPDFRRILAITFTNKAANEMKERVLQALILFSREDLLVPGSAALHLQEQLVKETGLPEAELRSRASEALTLILHHYGEFAIGTIDSFSHRVIRTFAHDFGLPVAFHVHLDQDELLSAAVDLLLERAGRDEELTRLLVHFLESQMTDDKDWNIEKILIKASSLLLKEEGQEQISRLTGLSLPRFGEIARNLSSRIHAFDTALQQIGEEALVLMQRAGTTPDLFFQGSKGLPAYFRYLAGRDHAKYTPNSYVAATIEEGKWTSRKATPSDEAAIEGIREQLTGLYRKAQEMLNTGTEQITLMRLLRDTIYPLAVLNETKRMMEAFKQQQNLVHISEFNTRIAQIVLNEPIPFIYERLGEKYQHILMDEFQDTSRLQWHNFIPLIENALAGGFFNLVVGDGKQAIYRWRSGDATQFTSLPAIPGSDANPILREREAVLKAHYMPHQLTANYRSGYAIVRFNNQLFSWLSGTLDLPRITETYATVEQEPKTGFPGSVTIDFLSESGEDDEGYKGQTINRVEEIIRAMRDKGFTLRDIAVLCRSNDNAARISRELILRGIDVVSSESLLLNYSPEVRFITGFIRLLFQPGDKLLQGALITYLHRSGRLPVTGPDLHPLLVRLTTPGTQEDPFYSLLHENNLFPDAARLLSLPLTDLCEEIIRLFRLHQQPDAYIQFFQDAVISFSGNELLHNSAFPDWWEEHRKSLSIVVPEGMDAVRVMTIHKAKGLEFPVVIYPYADNSVKTDQAFLWLDLTGFPEIGLDTAFVRSGKTLANTSFGELFTEEQEKSLLDLINIFYVAMTRAEQALFVLSARPPASPSSINSIPLFLKGFLQSTGDWQDDLTRFSFGTLPEGRGKSRSAGIETVPLKGNPSFPWRNRIRIKPAAPWRWNREEPDPLTGFGTLVHSLLAGIRTTADTGNVLREALFGGLCYPADRRQIELLLQDVVSHPRLIRHFSGEGEVKTEPEILDAGGALFRPDRIVIRDTGVTLIEYKTGKPNPRHNEQLEHYAQLLAEMDYTVEEKLLVYIGDRVEVLDSTMQTPDSHD